MKGGNFIKLFVLVLFGTMMMSSIVAAEGKVDAKECKIAFNAHCGGCKAKVEKKIFEVPALNRLSRIQRIFRLGRQQLVLRFKGERYKVWVSQSLYEKVSSGQVVDVKYQIGFKGNIYIKEVLLKDSI